MSYLVRPKKCAASAMRLSVAASTLIGLTVDMCVPHARIRVKYHGTKVSWVGSGLRRSRMRDASE